MNKLVYVWAFLAMMANTAQAQEKEQDRMQYQLQEYFMCENGAMYQIQNQQKIKLQTQQQLRNGIQVNPDGTYQLQNKKQLRLQDGECLDMNGNSYKSQEQFQNKMQSRSKALAQEHFMFQNGKMMQLRDGQQTRLQERTTLQNGTIVNPDGSYQLKNGKRLQLRDGECLDPAGLKYKNQEQFCDKMEMKMQERLGPKQSGNQKGTMKQGGGQQKGKN